jgi:hypothetical protein
MVWSLFLLGAAANVYFTFPGGHWLTRILAILIMTVPIILWARSRKRKNEG